MTYFLEKHYEYGNNGTLVPTKFYQCLVRPCDLSYEEVLERLTNPSKYNDYMIECKGQIACLNCTNGFAGMLSRKFSTPEEWLIWLNFDHGIIPDFEDIHINAFDNTEYVVKTTDLHTNKVIYDVIEKTMHMIRQRQHKFSVNAPLYST